MYTGLDGGFTLVFDIRTFSLVVGCLGELFSSVRCPVNLTRWTAIENS